MKQIIQYLIKSTPMALIVMGLFTVIVISSGNITLGIISFDVAQPWETVLGVIGVIILIIEPTHKLKKSYIKQIKIYNILFIM